MYSSSWYEDFDKMAYKTMLRQLISRWGIMSIDMQNAFENDMTFTDDHGSKHYGDEAPEQPIDVEANEVPQSPNTAPSLAPAQQAVDPATALFG